MVGTLRAAVFVLAGIGAAVAVLGAALWIAGAAIVVRPTSFVATSTAWDPAAPAGSPDASWSVTFTVALVMDQPWVDDGFQPYRLDLSAAPSAAISDVRIANLAILLCEASCSGSQVLDLDMANVNETAPNHWVTYPTSLLFAMDWGTPAYITYTVPLGVTLMNGSRYAGGWSSGVHLAPIVVVPDRSDLGQAVFTWGAVLCAATVGSTILPRFVESRRRP